MESIKTQKEYRERKKKHKRCKIPHTLIDDVLLLIIQDSYKVIHGNINLKKLADYRYSRYIRTSKSKDGICECITCGKKFHWTEIQNGHFKSRGFMKYRYDDENCYPQCYYCNCIINGNYKRYTLKMIDLKGLDRVTSVENDIKPFKLYPADYIKITKDSYTYVKNFIDNHK